MPDSELGSVYSTKPYRFNGAATVEFSVHGRDNIDMVFHGHIENGIIVFPPGIELPNGTEVTVIVQMPIDSDESHRVRLPLVSSRAPGSRQLTAERVAELLTEDDLST